MPIKPDTRNYGKDHPRYQQEEKSIDRAGEDTSALRNALDKDLWLSRKDPYPKEQEVDPPRDWNESDFNRHPEQLPGRRPWSVDDQSDA